MTKADCSSFTHKLARLKLVLGRSKDKEVCAALGLKVTAFSARKARDAFPEKELRALAQKFPELGIDVNYVLTGVADTGRVESMDRSAMCLCPVSAQAIADFNFPTYAEMAAFMDAEMARIGMASGAPA